MFYEKDLLLQLLKEVEKSVIYCEDCIQVLALIKGIPIYYYSGFVGWYEYATGISTTKDNSSAIRVQQDSLKFNQYIIATYEDDFWVKRRKRMMKLNARIKSRIFRGAIKAFLEPGIFLILFNTKIQALVGRYSPKKKGYLNDDEFIKDVRRTKYASN